MRFDLNRLLSWAQARGVSFHLTYSEAPDELEIQVHSPAKTEEFYMKRVPNIEYFIQAWNDMRGKLNEQASD